MTASPPTAKADSKPPPKSLGRGLLLIAVILALPLFAAMMAIFVPGPAVVEKIAIVPHGTHVNGIGIPLKESDAVYSTVLFRLAARLLANDALKAGEYQIAPHASMASIIIMMHDGRSVVRMFTVAEGLTSIEIAHLLEDNPVLSGEVPPPPPEGSLLPESYRYIYGDSRASIIARMQKAMQETLAGEWAHRDPGLSLKSPQEALVMASLIEKETAKKEERSRIARVFYNRLAHNMRLQSDPTVIYALNKGDGPLNRTLDRRDLAVNSPYNTYINDGLPPGPICNPGRASIEAALHPEPNDFLYFVADGNGGHVFTTNLNEHNRNVAKWDKIKAQAETTAAAPAPAAKPAAP